MRVQQAHWAAVVRAAERRHALVATTAVTPSSPPVTSDDALAAWARPWPTWARCVQCGRTTAPLPIPPAARPATGGGDAAFPHIPLRCAAHAGAPEGPPLRGFAVVPEAVPAAEAAALLAAADRENGARWRPTGQRSYGATGRMKQEFGPLRVRFNTRRLSLVGDADSAATTFPPFLWPAMRRLSAMASALPADLEMFDDDAAGAEATPPPPSPLPSGHRRAFVPAEASLLRYASANDDAGGGLDPHLDDAWAWGGRLAALSLESPALMTFARPRWPGDPPSPTPPAWNVLSPESGTGMASASASMVTVDVLLPPRSAWLLWGEARYEWLHGLAPGRGVRGRRTSLGVRELPAPLAARHQQVAAVVAHAVAPIGL